MKMATTLSKKTKVKSSSKIFRKRNSKRDVDVFLSFTRLKNNSVITFICINTSLSFYIHKPKIHTKKIDNLTFFWKLVNK